MAIRTGFLLISVLAAAAGKAAGKGSLADLPLEKLMQLPVQTISTASRYEQKTTRAPASVTVVNAEDIARFGYRTLADILGSAAGFSFTYDRNYTYLGVRGFSRPGDFNTRVLLLIDGHRVNDALYGLTYVGQEALLDVDMIDRVEIIRGPASSIYGNSAILGVVNVITRRDKAIDGLELAATGGSFEAYQARAAYGKAISDALSVTFSGSYYDTDGYDSLYYPEFDSPETNGGVAVDSDGEHASRFFGNVTYREFSLSAGYSKRYKSVPTAPYGTAFNSGLVYTKDQRGYLDLKYEHSFDDSLQLLARATYDNYPYSASLPVEADGPLIVNRDLALSRWGRTELQLTKRFSPEHVLTMGAEYQDTTRLHQKYYSVDPYELFTDTVRHSRNYGVYAQGELALPANLLLNAGARYDHFESFGGTVNPRAALIYNPLPRVTLKALHGRAFRAPSEYEANYQSRNQSANAGLRPERTTTNELVYEQYLGAGTRLSLSGYQYHIEGLISLVDVDQTLQIFRNTDRARSRGIELELQTQAQNGIEARGSFSLQRTRNTTTGEELEMAPRQLGRVAVTVPLMHSFLLGSVEARYSGKAVTVNRQTTGSYTLLNVTVLAHQLARDLELSGSVYNVLDHLYSTPSADTGLQDVIEQDGRTFRVQLVYRPKW